MQKLRGAPLVFDIQTTSRGTVDLRPTGIPIAATQLRGTADLAAPTPAKMGLASPLGWSGFGVALVPLHASRVICRPPPGRSLMAR